VPSAIIRLTHDYFEDAGTALLLPAGQSNSGEIISLIDDFFADSATGIAIADQGDEVEAVNCSFDFNATAVTLTAPTILRCAGAAGPTSAGAPRPHARAGPPGSSPLNPPREMIIIVMTDRRETRRQRMTLRILARLHAPAAACLLLLPVARAQTLGFTQYGIAGTAVAARFQWHARAKVVSRAGGSGTIQFDRAWRTLRDGTAFEPYAVGVPITVHDGAQSETVVPTASTCAVGGAAPCAVTANFRYAHGARLEVQTGTAGLAEAAAFLRAAGGTVLLPPGGYTVGADLTLPPQVNLQFLRGAVLTVPTPVTLTIEGQIEAGNFRIFSVTAPTTVTDAAMVAGSTTLTSSEANFSATQVGSRLYVLGASATAVGGRHLPQTGVLTAVAGPGAATASFPNASGAALAQTTAIFGGSYVVPTCCHTASVNPRWWGAVGDGETDDTAAIQETMTAAALGGLPVDLGAGTYAVSHPIDGGDPMQDGNYSPSGQVGGAASIIGGNASTYASGFAAIGDAWRPGQFVLYRRNMAGVEWRGFTVNGNARASCLDASWIIPPGVGGPSAQDIFEDLRDTGCLYRGMVFDNDNDSTIQSIHDQGTAGAATTASTAVAAGSADPVYPASMAGIYPGSLTVVGSGATQEEAVVASVTTGSFTPMAPWRYSHGPGAYTVAAPGVGIQIDAEGGEQSIVEPYAVGELKISVQDGAIVGGWLGGGLEASGQSYNDLTISGTQIAANPLTGVAINSTNTGFHGTDQIDCDACYVIGPYAVAGKFAEGITFHGGLVDPGTAYFSDITTGQCGYFPVFRFYDVHLFGLPPAPADNRGCSGYNWVVDNSQAPNGTLTSRLASAGFKDSSPLTVLSSSTARPALTVRGSSGADLLDAGTGGPPLLRAQDNGLLDVAVSASAQAPAAADAVTLGYDFDGQQEADLWNDAAGAAPTALSFDWRVLNGSGQPQSAASLDHSGDFTAAGGLAGTSLTLGGGAALTGQTGTGSNIVTDRAPTLTSPTLAGTPTLPARYLTGGATISQPAATGTLALTGQLPFAATPPTLGGAALGAGQCASTTVAVPGANASQAVAVTPVQYPGAGFYWQAYVSAPGVVTVSVCAAVAGTPAASAYNVRVIP
jgi:hypothetical protein